jgi:predicted 3-demethylubiquinone-9 3-methyltransferase (glyoxalase superfamily)/uncharacterized protein YdhG (YjbR/CyaY superfamily)
MPAGKPRSIGEYLAALSAEKRAVLESLRRNIRAAAPAVEESISYGLPAFRMNGRLLVAFGASSNHCSFHPGAHPLIVHERELKSFPLGKGTIRFTMENPLPAALVRRLVKTRIAQYSAMKKMSRKAANKPKLITQKITPFLWFDGRAGEAAKFYTSIFKHSSIESTSPMSATFWLDGQKFIALNGGPQFKFTEAISFFVSCTTQKEIDYYWDKLSAGGERSRCGWLKDKFGVSWQIVPTILGELLGDDDEEKSQRAMQAMLKMRKLDIKVLKRAHSNQSR